MFRCSGLLILIVIHLPGFGSSRINSSEAVEVGGIKQWISIKGTDTKKPVLLFLHGGPGNSAMSYAHKFTSELQKHFVIEIGKFMIKIFMKLLMVI